MKTWLALLTVLAGLVWTEASQAACYIVYIHGKGADQSPGVMTDAQRRGYWSPDGAESSNDFVRYSRGGCTTLVAGYNGAAAFWDDDAAKRVADQINAFITTYNIGDRELRLVGHSMGGLVLRWILNNGVAGSAYYNYHSANYARIVQKTDYAITVATPHLGSEAADAVYGTSDTLCGNFVGWIAGIIGERNNATMYLRYLNLEYASARGSWFQDAGRTRTIYTMATRTWNQGSSISDIGLNAVWDCLGNVGHWYLFTSDTPGDGLVTEKSGMLRYERSGSNTDGGYWGYFSWSKDEWVGGSRVDWVRISHNHNHVRYDDTYASYSNQLKGVTGSSWPGSYIGSNGLYLQ